MTAEEGSTAALKAGVSSGVSSRALRSVIPFNSYGEYYVAAVEKPWSPENQEGYINLCMAENCLHAAEVRDKLELEGRDPPSFVSGYVPGDGLDALKDAVAKFLERRFMAGVDVQSKEILVTNGTTTLLENLFYCLADEGDGILIPAPYYCAFTRDLQARAACVCIPVPEQEGALLPSVAALTAAKEEAESRGIRVRALLITNPHNPTGFVLPEEKVAELLLWAVEQQLHFVSDEIYAESVFRPSVAAFVSAARVAQRLIREGKLSEQAAQETLHILYGMSKDFCMNGYRVGYLWTRNANVMAAIRTVGDFSMVPVHLQYSVARLLADEAWVDAFLHRNVRSLLFSYERLTNGLAKIGIPFLPVGAGMFVWVDLRRLLAAPTFEEEMKVFHLLRERCKVLAAPGADSGNPVPGFFRMCFAASPPEALTVAIERIEELWNHVQNS